MQNVINFFCGNVQVEVNCSYPERFLNLCSQKNIEFWDMQTMDIGVFRIRMSVSDFKKLPQVARRAMCHVHIIERCGLPFFTYRFKKRAALIFGCAVFCLIAWVFTNFVWVINIDGFPELDAVKLRGSLADAGLSVGSYVPSVNISELRNSVLIDMPELAYVSVNFSGSHANVTARKRISPPEVLAKEIPCDIIADKDGVVCDITVKTGTPEVVRGDTVIKGQILASGYMTGRAGSTILTHADAEISLRTWRKKSARMQKSYAEKVYTGNEKELYTIILCGKRIKLYINSGFSYAKCDKIIEKTDLVLFDGVTLPISLERAKCREYKTETVQMSSETAYDTLGEGLHLALDIPESSEVVNAELRTSEDETFAYASIIAECIEKTGEEREILR